MKHSRANQENGHKIPSLLNPIPFIGLFLIVLCINSFVLSAQENQEVENPESDSSKATSEEITAGQIYGQMRGARRENFNGLQRALDDIQRQNFSRGYATLEQLGKDGSAEAYFHLGEIERLGILESGVNFEKAVGHYRSAAALGHSRAGLTLANMLYFDKGTNPAGRILSRSSVLNAIASWQQLAIEDQEEALYMLGLLYWNGDALLQQDPIRGYGLIWQAAGKGYRNAIKAEAQMIDELSFDAREAGREYARKLTEYGFSEDILRIDLVFNSIAPSSNKRSLPLSWNYVWRLELGIALQKSDVEDLIKIIEKDYSQIANILQYEIVPSAIRPTRHQLVMGPMESMTEAVRYCMRFKKNGIDCYAMAPETISE
ncbi:hypothetical protein QGN29_03285 [Temperatibacter marinus]|uniref:Uncharacterized protein n=1 Tax=Temperatibacter marinus TaxID=1456591 RepID=A0AA52EDC9_9PROT|nr:hypothetical protein [Temperatibacter marinus]WND03392.1 hypothetical protein QGN29_03285 [Temperatibacter marinus]